MPRNVIDDLPPIKTGPLIMYMTCWVVAGTPLGLAERVLNANDTLGGRGPPLMQTTTNDRWMDDNKKKLIIPGIMYITLTLY